MGSGCRTQSCMHKEYNLDPSCFSQNEPKPCRFGRAPIRADGSVGMRPKMQRPIFWVEGTGGRVMIDSEFVFSFDEQLPGSPRSKQ
jgi:hypothetical protein